LQSFRSGAKPVRRWMFEYSGEHQIVPHPPPPPPPFFFAPAPFFVFLHVFVTSPAWFQDFLHLTFFCPTMFRLASTRHSVRRPFLVSPPDSPIFPVFTTPVPPRTFSPPQSAPPRVWCCLRQVTLLVPGHPDICCQNRISQSAD